jgi:epoxyqueuosine reductase QueG
LAAVLTNAELQADKPYERDLCGDCEACLRACPVGALTAYKVDNRKCMLGTHLTDRPEFDYRKVWEKYEPAFTKNSHLMCMKCQKACKYGRDKR